MGKENKIWVFYGDWSFIFLFFFCVFLFIFLICCCCEVIILVVLVCGKLLVLFCVCVFILDRFDNRLDIKNMMKFSFEILLKLIKYSLINRWLFKVIV